MSSRQDVPAGRVIVFCTSRAGSGSTSLAANTAVALHNVTGESVVVVDADYASPAVHAALDLPPDQARPRAGPSVGGLSQSRLDRLLATHSSGVRALLAPGLVRERRPLSRSQVHTILSALKRAFSWVLVDLGSSLDEMAYAFLDEADLIVVPVLPEMAGLRDARMMLDQLFLRNYSMGKVWVIASRDGMSGGMLAEDLQQWLGVRVVHRIPEDPELANETAARGAPKLVGPGFVALARAYDGFAGRLVEQLAGPAVAPPPGVVEPAFPPPDVPYVPSGAAYAGGGRSRRRGCYGVLALLAGIAAVAGLLFLLLGRDPARINWDELISAPAALLSSAREAAATAVPALASPTAVELPAVALTPTQEPGAASLPAATLAPTAAPTATPLPTETPLPTATTAPTATRTFTSEPTAAPSPTATTAPSATLPPTATPSPTVTATLTPSPTSTPTSTPQPPATRRPAPTRTPTAVPAPVVSAPVLLSPDPNARASGRVTFSWQPTGPLPEGAGYEVVWWNMGQDPAGARGFAPPTTGASETVNLDVPYAANLFSSNSINWTVLIVTTDPYRRLTKPDDANARVLTYAPSSGGSASAPPPPRP